MNFDTEKIIVEIQQREAIWNCKGAVYKNRDIKRKQWEELVDIFGKEEMTIEEKKSVGKELQKKWKNIRDNFVKALKDDVTRSGSAAKKKSQYVFYNNLMFLKDTVCINETDSSMERHNERNETEIVNDTVVAAPPKRSKKKYKEDDIGFELINVLNKNLELKKAEEDEDRLFLLSLVTEMKKVPERLRLRTKAQIIQVITEAQTSGYNYCNSTWDYARPFNFNQGPSQGYQTPSFSRINNPPPPPPSVPSTYCTQSPIWNQESVASPESTNSQNTQTSQQSDYLDLFNDINSQ